MFVDSSKMIKNYALLALVLSVILGCVGPPREILLISSVEPAIEPDQVVLYFNNRPQCNFDVVGYISEDLAYSRSELMHRFKSHAAKVGAGAVIVTSIQNLDGLEIIGTAKAIRCL